LAYFKKLISVSQPVVFSCLGPTQSPGDKQQPKELVNTLGISLAEAARQLGARILWEGFENAASVRACLFRVRDLTPKESQFHRWALGYLETLPLKE
jgi:hypothetical protein